MIRYIHQFTNAAGSYTFVLQTDTQRLYRYQGRLDASSALITPEYLVHLTLFKLELIYV